MSSFAKLVWLLLLAGLSTGVYLTYSQHNTQAQLGTVLQQLDATLTTQNDEAATTAHNSLKGIENVVAKNRNQPAELAVLHRAQALASGTQELCGMLRRYRAQLRPAASRPAPPTVFAYPEPTAAVAQLLGSGTPAQRALRQHLAAYADTLRQLGPAMPTRLTAPAFDQLPVAEALAALSLLEARVRASEFRALRHLARPLGAPLIPTRFVAAATAVCATVAPGSTYQARLLVVKSLLPSSMRMYCNGQPVPVGPDGAGFVRFRAPRQAGPASWVGRVRINHNGRDTTFVVRVPYRVASR
ncbi:hypothetical protein GCM10027422_16480 [Hymenobacter arcticus]